MISNNFLYIFPSPDFAYLFISENILKIKIFEMILESELAVQRLKRQKLFFKISQIEKKWQVHGKTLAEVGQKFEVSWSQVVKSDKDAKMSYKHGSL